jgi:hypothetical protein
VFILTEKDAIVGSIEGVASKFGVTIYTIRGFASKTRAHDIGLACREAVDADKQVHILYLGDFDPSGVSMQADVARRIEGAMAMDLGEGVRLSAREVLSAKIAASVPENRQEEVMRRSQEMVERGDFSHDEADFRACCRELKLNPKTAGLPFQMRRLAIHREDIAKFNLPPLRVKDSDSRTPGFLLEHGPNCVELDALPPSELRRRLTVAIRALIDKERWARDTLVEKAERDFTKNLMKNFRQMAGSGNQEQGMQP